MEVISTCHTLMLADDPPYLCIRIFFLAPYRRFSALFFGLKSPFKRVYSLLFVFYKESELLGPNYSLYIFRISSTI